MIAGETMTWRYDTATSQFSYGGKRHYHLDHLGSVRVVTNPAGRAISENDFYPFGKAINRQYQEQINHGNSHTDGMRFAGHWRDFLGYPGVEDDTYLDYMHARYYDPNAGRFLSPDPVLGNLLRPQGWNRYTYVFNNPLKFTDPRGLQASGALRTGNLDCSDGRCTITITVTAEDPLREVYAWLAERWAHAGAVENPVTGLRAAEHWNANVQGLAAFADGFNPIGDPLAAYYGDGSVAGTEFSYGTGFTTFQLEALIAATYGGGVAGDVVTVTRWGRPGLESGDWVMLGGRSIRNWLFSGKAQWWGSNETAAFSTGQTFRVAASTLRSPNERLVLINLIKMWLGQRRYLP